MFTVGLYQNMKSTEVFKVDVIKILGGIKDGRWKEKVEQYRSTGDTSIKDSLPAFTVGGIFHPSKTINNLKIQSGLLSLDIDDFNGSLDDLYMILSRVLKYSLFSIFKSTGGKGYCALVHIKEYDNYDQFKRIYNSVYQSLKEAGLCEISKFDWLPNLNRLRFVSYDPDLYISYKTKEYVDELEIEQQVTIFEKGEPKKFVLGGGLSDDEKFSEVLSKYIDSAGNFGEKITRHQWILGIARWACRADIDEGWLFNKLVSNYQNSSRPDIWNTEVAKCIKDSYRAYSAERGRLEPTKKFDYGDILKATNVEQVREQVYMLIADKLNYVEYLTKEGKNSTFVEKEVKFLKKLADFI